MRGLPIITALGALIFGLTAALAAPAAAGLYGTLQSASENAAEGRRIGLNVAVISVAWDRFEPRPGGFDEAYIGEIAARLAAFRRAGYRLALDPGIQYAPAWVAGMPNGRYRNQYGDFFRDAPVGERLPNVVFSAAVRERVHAYFRELFARLGGGWDFVRLGGGKFGELNYPSPRAGGRENGYWAFDDLAQGKAPGLAGDVPPCPVPGWVPGTPSPDHRDAARFAGWYLDALKAYQQWQIAAVREWYPGDICLLYGSWGLRPGELGAAVGGDLKGATPAERNGELQQGYDWERMISAIRDPRVIVYCTWMDGTLGGRELGDDASPDPRRWSPVHWQASLARANPLRLRVWGENTGGNNREAMRLVFEHIRRDGLLGVVWAFENELRAAPNPRGWATWADFAGFIAETPPPPER